MTFKELNIIEPIMKALTEKGYSEPTPIQQKAIPLVLAERDVLGVAQTGTGKTAAFAIPIIQLIRKDNQNHQGKPIIKALIVTPTRELAIQIDENIRDYSKHTNLRHTVIFGGVKQHSQVQKLKQGVDILTATPGRLLDLIDQGYIRIDQINMFILDEADRMLDMGFINDIRKLLKIIPEKRQSLFFSATMPKNIIDLSNKILDNPIKVEVTPESTTAETIQQVMYYTNRSDKGALLIEILKERNIDQALVFTRTKHGADRVARNLTKKGINAYSIHGDKAQNQRQRSLKLFKEGKIRVLVATDIAARGIDIDKLKYVINYEIPNMPETYVHRIGRSGRAGEEGIAIGISEPEENQYVKDIEKLIGIKIAVATSANYPQTDKPMTPAEKKEWEKEKQKRKQEFFANRKAKKSGQKGGKSRNKSDKPKGENKSRRNNNNRNNDDRNTDRSNRNENRPDRSESKERREGNQNNNSRPNENKSSQGSKNSNRKKHNKKRGGYKSTEASAKLKGKFKWPLEK
jgi:ATP-dependent RNA helicase RhlE